MIAWEQELKLSGELKHQRKFGYLIALLDVGDTLVMSSVHYRVKVPNRLAV